MSQLSSCSPRQLAALSIATVHAIASLSTLSILTRTSSNPAFAATTNDSTPEPQPTCPRRLNEAPSPSPESEFPPPDSISDTLKSPPPENVRPGIFAPLERDRSTPLAEFDPAPDEADPSEVKNDELSSTTEFQFDTYRLGPGDTIAIIVDRFPELNFQGPVNLEGNIILPLVGVLRLEGLTIAETEWQVQAEYDCYVINPSLVATLLARRPVQVTVIGEIVRPGFYPLGLPSVSAALLSAGGATADADLRNIVIRRTMPDGSALERSIDLFTPLWEGTPLPKEKLQDGDVIEITKLQPGQIEDYDLTAISRSTLVQPTIRIRIINRVAGVGFNTITVPNGSTFADIVASISAPGANTKRIGLIRFDPEQGKAVTRKLNAKRALLGEEEHNILLRDNDVIAIGPTFLTRVTTFLNTFTQPFRDTLGFLLFFRELGNSADSLFGPTGR